METVISLQLKNDSVEVEEPPFFIFIVLFQKNLLKNLLKMTSTGTALFGSNIGSSSKNLVEFRAGKMKLNGTTVTADKRKGLVYVFQGEDSLMHFCWKDRTTSTVEDVCWFKYEYLLRFAYGASCSSAFMTFL